MPELCLTLSQERRRPLQAEHSITAPGFCTRSPLLPDQTQRLAVLQSKGRGWFTINYYRKDLPLSVSGGSPPHTHLLGSKCPLPKERCLSMPETVEKARNYLFKSYTDLE